MFREDYAHEKGLICIADNKILQENLLLGSATSFLVFRARFKSRISHVPNVRTIDTPY